MRKLFTSLCVAVLTVVGAASAWAQPTSGTPNVIYRKTEKITTSNELSQAQYIAIEAVANNSIGFFGGAAPLSPNFQSTGSTVYKLLPQDGGKYALQLASTNEYMQAPTGQVLVSFSNQQTSKGQFTIHLADGGDELGTPATGIQQEQYQPGVEREKLWRVYQKVGNNSYILNSQGTGQIAWRKGKLNWTTFYIWKVEQVSTVSVKMNYAYEGKVIEGTEKVLHVDPTRPYSEQGVIVASYYGLTNDAATKFNKVPTAEETVTINYTMSSPNVYPFSFSENVSESGEYYTLQVKGQYAKYNPDKANEAACFELGNEIHLDDKYRFQFVGNPLSGFSLYNKAVGTTKALRVASNKVNEDNATFNVLDNGAEVKLLLKERGGQFFFLIAGTTENYVNHRAPYLSTWRSSAAIDASQNGIAGDAGSRILFKKASDKDFYTQLLTEYKEQQLKYYVHFPAVFKNVSTIKAEIEALPYSDYTEQGLAAAKRAVDQSIAKIEEATKAAPVKVLIKNRTNHSEYMESTLAGELYARSQTATAAHQYELRYQGNHEFLIYSSVARNFVQGASKSAVVKSGAEEKRYRLDIAPGLENVSNAANFFSVGSNEYGFLHYAPHQQNGVVGWVASADASKWVIEPTTISEQDVQAAIAEFAKLRYDLAKEKFARIPVDEHQFGCAQPTQQSAAATTKIEEFDAKIASGTQISEEEYDAAIAVIDAGTNSLTRINGLKNNAFYTFRAVEANRYLSAPATTKVLESTPELTLANVFYVKDGVLISVKEGKQVGVATHAALLGYGEAGLTISGEALPDNKQVAYVKVGPHYTYVHSDGNIDGFNNLDLNNLNGFKFEVKEVTEIPLPIREIGYASFYTPVALTVQEGYTAYKATKDSENGTTLALTEIQGVIPAQTAFLIKGTSGTVCKLTLTNESAAPSVVEGNILSGGVETTAIQGTAYALTKKGESEAVFGKVSAEVKQIAFRAFYINNTVNPVNEMSFSFKSTLTGVAPLKGNNEAAPLYDLSGRRVPSPAKGGIYIQNGQKIIAQ